MKTTPIDLVVIGSGPGGYAAAFYAADLGKSVLLVEKDAQLGGVCLNRGCIPSKALLHASKIVREAAHANEMGISFGKPKFQLDQLRAWKNQVLHKLSSGIQGLAKKRKVQVVTGRAHFEDSNTLRIETDKGQVFFSFENAIIATGSRPAMPSAFDLGNPRIMTSTEALEVEEIPDSLLVVGGGYIGMELSTVYATLGSKVTVVEAGPSLLAGADSDLVRPVAQFAKTHFSDVCLDSKVEKMATQGKQIAVTMTTDGKKKKELYDRVLVSIGRAPNSEDLGLENTQVQLDEKGYIKVDKRQRTQDSKIYAIGDIVGGMLLAHKASKEARIAVEAICGHGSEMTDDILIPAVVFTDPEVAWCGLTENEAKKKGIEVKVAKFSWGASGRALTLDSPNGLTKLVVDPKTERILGVGIVGPHAGDLISEGVLAIQMGATVEDLALTVHPHPTLSETLMEAAEVFLGHCVHT